MKIAVTSQGMDLDSPMDPRLGRAAYILIVDSDNMGYEVLDNAENVNAFKGAGIQAAQWIAQHSVDIVVSGNMGPKAFEALREAGVQMVSWDSGTVAEAIELVRNGELKPLDAANARGHWR